MTSSYLEIILEASPGVDPGDLCDVLRKRGVEAHQMKVGVLVAGDIEHLRTILPGLTGIDQPEVPVPDELKGMVQTIYPVKPRTPY
jgi:hypothetical protein